MKLYGDDACRKLIRILIICLSSSPQRKTRYGQEDVGSYEKQVALVRIRGQVMDRYRDTKPKPAVILVISILAVEEHNG